jgi:uncharacterized membrane protein YesL
VILFMLKKAFFDMWDNLFPLILMNLGFILLLSVPIYLPYLLVGASPELALLALAMGILILFVYGGGLALATKELADYQAVSFKDFWGFIKQSWKYSLVLGGIFIVQAYVLSVAIPVYAGMKSILGLIALVVLFWASVIWLLSSQYFYPILTRLDQRLPKIFKKCFILFFDNTGFTLFLGTLGLTVGVLSMFTAFLLPGPAAVMLWGQVGFKLRLMKYDWLEQNPGAKRKDIPWDVLLIDEQERVGKRTLKGMIFPWKE